MKYLLVVGFFCNVYKVEPKVRIFLNDILIDEVIVEHQDKIYPKSEKHFLDQLPAKEKTDLHISFEKVLPKFLIYNIDVDDNWKKIRLKLDVDNDDSNYSNGFMTKSTLLILDQLFLLPENKNLYLKFKDWRRKKMLSANYAWFCSCHRDFFNCTTSLYWNQNERKKVEPGECVGGSGYFECELYKKYKIFIPDLSQPYRFNLQEKLIEYIYDKYSENEN